MTGRPFARLLAWLIDWLCVLGWVAVTAVVGVPLYLSGVTAAVGQVGLNVIATVVTVVPVVLWLSVSESSRQATVGKRVRGLKVVDAATGAPVSFARALVRNTLKIGVPWLIGHAAAIAIVGASAEASVPPQVWVLTAVAYVLPLSYVVSLFIGSGRTPYDFVARTVVRAE
jgi:uncharacterized RDD family membrane protein YckC